MTLHISSEINDIFARAYYRVPRSALSGMNPNDIKEASMKGANIFKRKSLGFFGKEKIVPLEQLIEYINQANLVETQLEARKLVPALIGYDIKYRSLNGDGISGNYLTIERVSVDGHTEYSINTWSIH